MRSEQEIRERLEELYASAEAYTEQTGTNPKAMNGEIAGLEWVLSDDEQ